MSRNIIILILVAVMFVGGYAFNKYYGGKLAKLSTALNFSDKLIKEKDGVIGRMGFVITEQDQALSFLNSNIRDVIEERNLLLRENVSLNIRIDSFSTQLDIGEAEIDSSGDTFYPLGPDRWGIFEVHGKLWSICKPSKFEWGIKQIDPFELSIGLAETKDRTVKMAFANSSWKDAKLDTIIFDYVPYSPPWYSKLFVNIGAQSSLNEKTPVGVQLGLGYDNIGGGIVIDSHARSYYVNYRWSPWK